MLEAEEADVEDLEQPSQPPEQPPRPEHPPQSPRPELPPQPKQPRRGPGVGKSERMLAEISEKAMARRSGTTMFRYDNVSVKTYMGKKYITPSKGSFTSTIIDDIGLSCIIDTNPADIYGLKLL